MSMTRKTLSLFAAGIAALAVAGAASAANSSESLSARVRYGDLNLASDAGVAHLYARLRHAANDVCPYASFREVVDQRCAAAALDSAVANVDNDRLTALHVRVAGAGQAASSGS
jgi:UrcA family protein